MKAKRIYSEKVESLADMSKDRIILDLSYNEFQQLLKLIDATRWPTVHKYNKIGRNFDRRLDKALKQAEVEWR